MAKLYFKYGSMNSGKTTMLLQTAYNYEEQGMKVIVAKPSIDIKGNDKVVARIGIERKVDIILNDDDNIYNIIKDKFNDIDCLIIDEAQFITFRQADQLLQVASLLDIAVICYGLRSDFMMNGFIGSNRLLIVADKIEEIKTICKCGKKATINVRKMNGEYVFQGNQIAIDGLNDISYESMCPKCYYSLRRK